jgi:hypothetical protein
MQQFTVPQFIDVESQIIGPITTRQFIILLVAAVIVAASYKLFDFSLFVLITIIVGLLAVLFAFVKVNGRPFHYFVLNIVQTTFRPRARVWNNRLKIAEEPEIVLPVKENYVKEAPKMSRSSRLEELALIVDTQGRYKGENK